MGYPGKIITLWTVFLLGLLFHTELGLMPLFHGVSVASTHAHDTMGDVSTVLWLMLGFFVVPMIAIIGTAFTSHPGFRIGHFWLTVIYSVLNFLHVALDLTLQPIVWSQITLMIVLFAIGAMLNVVSFAWMKEWKYRH